MKNIIISAVVAIGATMLGNGAICLILNKLADSGKGKRGMVFFKSACYFFIAALSFFYVGDIKWDARDIFIVIVSICEAQDNLLTYNRERKKA